MSIAEFIIRAIAFITNSQLYRYRISISDIYITKGWMMERRLFLTRFKISSFLASMLRRSRGSVFEGLKFSQKSGVLTDNPSNQSKS